METLHGGGPKDFRDHCLTVGGKMLELAGQAADLAAAEQQLAKLLDNGTAWRKFEAWITAQGGQLDQLANPSRLPTAPLVETVSASRGGYIAGINAAEVGKAVVALGGGRTQKGDPIDHGVGVVHHAKVGEYIEAQAPLLTIHANSQEDLVAASDRLLAAITWSDVPVEPPLHTLKVID